MMGRKKPYSLKRQELRMAAEAPAEYFLIFSCPGEEKSVGFSKVF